MVLYRRNYVPGGTYFFTATLRNRQSDCLTRHIDALRAAFAEVKRQKPFHIDAIVVLPEHLHTIWTLPEDDADYSGRWQAIKSAFVRKIRKEGEALLLDGKGNALLWQSRFWEHTIHDEADYARHVDYIHFNPVKHGHAQHVADWPYSSFHQYLARHILPIDWAGGLQDEIGIPE
ncbi:putative transposase [Formivibrio citricus]|uniref:Putative transposase n=1 Tax=Formivibrio citricus TaxID=83765 RepID=A0A1I5DD21_9NEIS|nr:transposase [Formivibrio citricus]SFN96691.1 putative transposase [Formivibrio citricus]